GAAASRGGGRVPYGPGATARSRRRRGAARGGCRGRPPCAAVRTARFPPRMSTLIFVLVWVLLGLGLLLVAMGGGPGGTMKGLMSESRRSRRVAVCGFIVALLVLGIGVPAAVIAAATRRDSIPESNVKNLTASEQRGRELFGRRCASC